MLLKRYFKSIIFLVLSSLNKLDALTNETKRFSNPIDIQNTYAGLKTETRAWMFLVL